MIVKLDRRTNMTNERQLSVDETSLQRWSPYVGGGDGNWRNRTMVSDILIKDNQLMTTIAVGAGENIKDPLSRLAESWCPGTRVSFIMPGYIHFSRFFFFFLPPLPCHPLPEKFLLWHGGTYFFTGKNASLSQQSIPPSLSFLRREERTLLREFFPRFVRVFWNFPFSLLSLSAFPFRAFASCKHARVLPVARRTRHSF